MTNKLIGAFLAASIVALSSPAQADSAKEQIEKLNELAIHGYVECFTKAWTVKLWLRKNPKKIEFEPLDLCIQDRQDKVDEAILDLIPLILEKPNALKALMDFRSMWISELARVVEEEDDRRAVKTIRDAVTAVRIEAAK